MVLPFLISVAAGALFIITLSYGFAYLQNLIPMRSRPTDKIEEDHVQILVLGDIGRSPRMQYHAISVAKTGRQVDIVAYKETARHPDLIGKQNVTMYSLAPLPEWIDFSTAAWPKVLQIPVKVLFQNWVLFNNLMYKTPAAQWIIIQNPPSIPTFHVALVASVLRGSKVLVDWHNYGHTILAQKSKWYGPLASVYKFYETRLGRILGDEHLAVTDAMTRQLKETPFRIQKPIHTLHDRPAEIFQPFLSPQDRKAFLSKLPETQNDAQNIVDGVVRLVVSSTSWTPDEDFGMLLDALVAYAAAPVGESINVPSPILAIITGKGPEKERYVEKIRQLQEAGSLPGIRILTAWLSNRDYASLLACADLGISLHKSTSGVDLPMKVVDMFGAGLPVAAYSSFESFGELVKEGQNGCGFATTTELTAILRRLLGMMGEDELASLKKGAVREGSLRWDEEWNRVVGTIIERSAGQG